MAFLLLGWQRLRKTICAPPFRVHSTAVEKLRHAPDGILSVVQHHEGERRIMLATQLYGNPDNWEHGELLSAKSLDLEAGRTRHDGVRAEALHNGGRCHLWIASMSYIVGVRASGVLRHRQHVHEVLQQLED
ncbi:hypothetical protein IOCL2690_000236500 [Leishmania lindenbergi]|uniref:Uncharacterized protein n=1 Tax=Leishmania lindenbergi TaxID=651832 RepID=A0AAW3AQ67_9TRYP